MKQSHHLSYCPNFRDHLSIDGKDSADGQQASMFTQPVALFDSAAGVATTTPASGVLFAGQDMTLTAATALRMTAGQAATVVSAKSTSLFTHAGGAKLIAAKEPVSVRAHTGPMDLIAEQAMTLTSSNGSIRVQAKQEVLLASGGGYIRLTGGNVDIHCPASVSVKGTGHSFMGAGSMAATLSMLPNSASEIRNWIAVTYHDAVGAPMADVGYKIKFDNGPVLSGKLDAAGHARHVNVPQSAASVEYEQRTPKPDATCDSVQNMVAGAKRFFADAPQ